MTNSYDRRVRRLEASAGPETVRVLVFGYPGRSDPEAANVHPSDLVIRLRFVPPATSVGGSHAIH